MLAALPGRAMAGPTQSTSVRSPFLKGSALAGVSDTIASSYMVAVNLLLLSEISSVDTSPTVLAIH
jgi:hypothetical protein